MDIKLEDIARTANVHRDKPRSFQVGDKVFVKTVRQEKINWHPGTVIKVLGQVTYLVKVENRVRFVHADHLCINTAQQEEDENVLLQFLRERYQTSPQGSKSPEHPTQVTPNKNEDSSSHLIIQQIDLSQTKHMRSRPQKILLFDDHKDLEEHHPSWTYEV